MVYYMSHVFSFDMESTNMCNCLFWKKVTGLGVALGILVGFLVGTPLSIFANVSENTNLIVLSAILGLFVGGLVTILVSLATKSKKNSIGSSEISL